MGQVPYLEKVPSRTPPETSCFLYVSIGILTFPPKQISCRFEFPTAAFSNTDTAHGRRINRLHKQHSPVIQEQHMRKMCFRRSPEIKRTTCVFSRPWRQKTHPRYPPSPPPSKNRNETHYFSGLHGTTEHLK